MKLVGKGISSDANEVENLFSFCSGFGRPIPNRLGMRRKITESMPFGRFAGDKDPVRLGKQAIPQRHEFRHFMVALCPFPQE